MVKTLIVCFFVYANLTTCYRFKSPYSMLGLFSISSCKSQSNFNCTSIPTTERIIRETTKMNEKLLNIELDMCNVDIGTDRNRLIGIFLDLMLNQETKQTCLGRTGLRTLRSKSIIVYMYTTHDLTVLASSIALPYDIIIIAVTFEPIISNYPLYNHSLFFYSYEASFGIEIHKTAINELRKELNVTYGAMINVYLQNQNAASYNCTGRENRAFCIYKSLTSEEGCWKEKSINVLDDVGFNQLVNAIEDDQRLSFIIIYGNNEALATFDAKLLRINKEIKEKWFVLPFEKTFDGKSTFNATSPRMGSLNHSYFFYIYDVPGATYLNRLFHFIHNFNWHMFHHIDVYNTIKRLDIAALSPYIKILFKKDSLNDVSWHQWNSYWNNIDRSQLKEIVVKTFAYDKKLMAGLFNFLKGQFYLDRVKTKQLKNQFSFNPTKALQYKPYCHLTKPTCQPGKELKHSYFQAKYWDASYGWFCQKCPINFHKSTNSNTVCIPCPKYTRSDPEKLFCYDPYEDNILSFDESITFICLSTACIIEVIFAIAVFFIFVKFRKTPLVRASNVLLSAIQISTHAVLSIMLIFLFMDKPSQEICIIRPVLIGVCFTLSTTINLGKTQKILMIFQKDVRMSRKEIVVTKASEILTILIMVILDVGIFGITIRGQLPDVETTYDEITLSREYYCDNNIAVLIQFAIIFVIVIFNVIQGIRCRNLPSYFRESTYVLYSSFTSCVIFIGAIGIYSAQENEHRRTILLFAICVILNMLHFLLMYSYKAFVVIFRPEKNTKLAFHEIRMKR